MNQRLALSTVLLCLLACTDPYSYEPGDPTKPDPPAPPQLIAPGDSWLSDSYIYPQEVAFGWQPIPAAAFYQFEVYNDWVIDPLKLVYANQRVAYAELTVEFNHYGKYYWRVRAASKNWNNYTAWSQPSRFGLPNPAK
jgi:hypothetical protein